MQSDTANPDLVLVPFDRNPHLLKRLDRIETILTLQETGYIAGPLGDGGQDDGAMRNRFVAGYADVAVDSAPGATDELHY